MKKVLLVISISLCLVLAANAFGYQALKTQVCVKKGGNQVKGKVLHLNYTKSTSVKRKKIKRIRKKNK